jgi:AhpC/TSA family
MRFCSLAIGTICCFLVGCGHGVPNQGPAKSEQEVKETKTAPSLADQIAAIAKEYDEALMKHRDDVKAANKVQNVERIAQLLQEIRVFREKQADKLKTLIRERGREPAFFDGIMILINQFRDPLDKGLVEQIVEHHLDNPAVGQICFALMYEETEWPEQLLEAAAAKHQDKAIRGQATYALGIYRYRTMRATKKLSEAEEAKMIATADEYFTEAAKAYGDVDLLDGSGKLGVEAAKQLIRIKNAPFLKVGKAAPEISGEDIDGKEFKLSDYRGKVVLLDFWGHW